MRETVKEKKKGPTSAVHQQALKLSELPPYTPEQQQPGKSSVEGAELQVEAARETYSFEWGEQDLGSIREYDIARAKRFFCTPDDVLYKLGNEWIKVTEENLVKVGVSPGIATFVLKQIRKSCERTNKVGWVLPRLETGVAQ
jgi:hypothetical protein